MPVKRLLYSFTASKGTPNAAVDYLQSADYLSAEIIFSANPSNDTVTVVVEG